MTNKPVITIEDFSRLLTELGADGPLDPHGWFDRNNLDEKIEDAIIQSAGRGSLELMLEGSMSGDRPGEVMANVCATMMLSGFALGWEMRKQYGAGDE